MKNIIKPEEVRGFRPALNTEQNTYSKNYGIKPLYKGYNKALRKTMYK